MKTKTQILKCELPHRVVYCGEQKVTQEDKTCLTNCYELKTH